MTKSHILAIAGSMGSGKTTAANLVASAIGWRRLSFCGYVIWLAQKKGILNPSRRALQDVGQEAVETDVREFVRGFLESNSFVTGEDVILDGLRHEQVLKEVRHQTEATWVGLVFLSASSKVRRGRLDSRESDEFHHAECHPVEAQFEKLRRLSDLEIDTSKFDEKQVAEQIQKWLGEIGAMI